MWTNITSLLHKWITYLLQDVDLIFAKKSGIHSQKTVFDSAFLYLWTTGSRIFSFLQKQKGSGVITKLLHPFSGILQKWFL